MGESGAKKSTEYAVIVAEAEASVSAVKDPELRRVAFEKILATLLERGQSKSRRPMRPPGRERGFSAAQKNGKRSGSATRQGPKRYVEELIDDGFFKEQHTIAEVKAELANRGHHIALTSLSGPLQKLTQDRRLRRQKLTTGDSGSKTAFAYSNW
jgi:hypothetical protein